MTVKKRIVQGKVFKTKGYHLEHNFGHGQNHLAELLLCLNLLAYLSHTTLDLVHITYQQVRAMLVTRLILGERNLPW